MKLLSSKNEKPMIGSIFESIICKNPFFANKDAQSLSTETQSRFSVMAPIPWIWINVLVNMQAFL